MDKAEARTLALARLRELRDVSWTELRERYLDNDETVEVTGSSGVVYQVETQAFWDAAKEGDIRVLVSVDDGGWSAFAPLGVAFILAPDGRFVGE